MFYSTITNNMVDIEYK